MEAQLSMENIIAFDDVDVKELSPLVLAHVGDAWFHLFVRVKLLDSENRVHDLHERSAQIVSAINQAHAYREIEYQLSEEERDIFRRGRNAKSHLSKSASASDYHTSTGFETLLGVLFLTRQFARLNEIADAAFDAIDKKLFSEEDQKL